jgi:transposase InsO family protein
MRRSPPAPLEVKLLVMEALETDLSVKDVAEIVGVTDTTISAWRKQYQEGGVSALCRRASSIAIRRQCSELEGRILAHRREHPEHGVRRIRDDLRRNEGLEVSAEKVRTVVNEAGLGQSPPTPHRRPPRVRRFERALPNALWQIDIFTFQLKRMYRVYLVGIIDDHSRFLVGWGLFRQQNADSVLEVVKGAIGQWGAPREILSDNGRQFVAWRGETRFQRVLKQQGIGHVRSAPHHPMTLGKIERFWQTLWREFLSEAVFASFADACQRIEHWISYYNHQRPHQGIEGNCPADRFYGLADDVEEAVRQGCRENSLRLALGQEPQSPLYLLGQLGSTDVRVVRKGEEIEVKVGDAVREVIRLGAPFEIREDGSYGRERRVDDVAGAERRGALPCGGAGPEGGSVDPRAVPDLRGKPSDIVPSHGGRGPCLDRGFGAEEAWPEAATGVGGESRGDGGDDGSHAEGDGPLAPEVRGGENDSGSSEADGEGRASAWRGGEKKAGPSEEETDVSGYGEPFCCWDEDEDGQGL